MSKNQPSYYKKKWYDYYERLAKAKGITFGPRQFKRIEYGFCMDEAFKKEGKSGIDGIFWWIYSDSISELVLKKNPLLEIIKSPPPLYLLTLPTYYKGNVKVFERKSHAQLWQTKKLD